MSAQDYYGGNSQGHQHNQQQGYGNTPSYNQDRYQSSQTNPADPYGYLSGNQSAQTHDQHGGHSPAPYHQQQQQGQSYNHNQGHNTAPYSGQAYQSYTQTNSYVQGQSYQEPHQQPSPQPYQSQPQPHDGRYSPQPPIYDQNRQHGSSPYPQQGYNPQTNPSLPPDADKGLMGAIGGAAAGGFAGHKVNHGFLGTVGGAFAGHKLEDAIKDKKKKKKDKFGRRNSNSSSSSSSSSSSDDEKKKKKKYGAMGAAAAGGGGAAYMHHQNQQQQPPRGQQQQQAMAGNFSSSSSNISLDRDFDLIASCRTTDGHSKLSSISLNDHLTNEWGQLKWMKGGGFGGSARNVRLVDGGRVLEAELNDGRGGWSRGYIRLDERIGNSNGDLVFV